MGFDSRANCALGLPRLWPLLTVIHYRFPFESVNFTDLSESRIALRSLKLPWWRWWDSNPWPPACRAGALPAELHPHICCLRQWYCSAVILLRSDIASQCYALGMGFCFFSKRSFKIEQRIDSYLDKTVCYVAYILVMYGRFSIERRWSSRTFRYGYLVTT